MKGELVNIIINKIDTDKRFLLSVFNLDSGLYLYKYYPATKILEKGGKVISFSDLIKKHPTGKGVVLLG